MMNPRISSISILSICTLLASINCRLIYGNAILHTTKDTDHPPLCVYPPPPSLRPPSSSQPEHAVWCVAKPTAPVAAMQQALDYACAMGADCRPIRVDGVCYQPDSVLAHSSYAMNSYWQRSKKGGGTCDFGGSAMLVTVDPSYDQCHFVYN